MATQAKTPGKGKKTTKKANAIFVFGVNLNDPSREEEFNDWYNNKHLPQLLALGVYHRATRWRNTNPASTLPQYIAIYESEWTDGAAAQKAMGEGLAELRKDGRALTSDTYTRVLTGTFNRIAEIEA